MTENRMNENPENWQCVLCWPSMKLFCSCTFCVYENLNVFFSVSMQHLCSFSKSNWKYVQIFNPSLFLLWSTLVDLRIESGINKSWKIAKQNDITSKLILIHCVVHRTSGPLHAGGVKKKFSLPKLKIAYLDFST